jgi:hypothetical protein
MWRLDSQPLQVLYYSDDLERSPCEISAFETKTVIRDPFAMVKVPVIKLGEGATTTTMTK